MQVKIKDEKQVFKPVTLEITFETTEEFQMMHNMLVWNTSIPKIIYEGDEDKQNTLREMMDNIRNIVLEAKRGD